MEKQHKASDELKPTYFVVDDLRARFGREFLSLSEAAGELGLAYGSLRNMVVEDRSPVRTVLIGARRVVPCLEIARLIYETVSGEKLDIQLGNIETPELTTRKKRKEPGRPSNEEKMMAGVRHG